ncbi:MAG: hypothetical protein JWN04_1982, partial [Myxococcaceae bacterium]|nr:hypothetical protein [Myxococcaceae bacterium]
DPTAYAETEELGIEGIPTVAVCCGQELLIENPERHVSTFPVAALARLQALALFDHELGRWIVPRDAAMDMGFVHGEPIDRSDERPDDFLDDGVDPDCLFSVLHRHTRLQDLKNLLDEVGFSAPPLKDDRTQDVVELYEESEISGMDIAKHLPRKGLTLIALILGVDIVGNVFQVRQRLAKAIEARYRRQQRRHG